MNLQMIRLLLAVCWLLPCWTAGAAEKPKDPDPMLAAMRDELARSMAELKLEDLERPYFIEYFSWDNYSFRIDAVFGAIRRLNENHRRPFRVDVRVGSYAADNSGFVGDGSFEGMARGGSLFLLGEDEYHALRHDLWYMTDSAYKQALEQLSAKQAALQNQVQSEKPDDFSKHDAVVSLGKRNQYRVDASAWKDRVRRLSALFKKYPEIQDSEVWLAADFTTTYLVNSEGSQIRQPATTVVLAARASAQAPDGMPCKNHVTFNARSLDQLPSEAVMTAAIEKMAGELMDLRRAPLMDSHTGPVLMAPAAAGEMIFQLLAPTLMANRPQLSSNPRMTAFMNGQEQQVKLNTRVLPAFLSVQDDPGKSEFGKERLVGGYSLDDEGMAGQPVLLVQKGLLKDLLSTRTPTKEARKTNGHARRGRPGFIGAQISNLFLQAQQVKSYQQLKQELLQKCKEQGLAYGLIIKRLNDPAITGWDPASASRGSKTHLTAPLMAYRVSLDGREELVRGLSFYDVTLRALRDIAAAGNDPGVINRSGAGSGFFEGGGGGAPDRLASIIAPSLLIEELSLKQIQTTQSKPVILAHPFFEK